MASEPRRRILAQLTGQRRSVTEIAAGWLDRYHEFWSERFDRLAALVDEDRDPPKPCT